MLLTPDIYDSAEAAALVHLPNRLIEAAMPVAFGAVGYPVKVANLQSLRRYAEVMHEARAQQLTQFLCGGLRQDEVAMFQRVVDTTAQMTETKFGRRRLPNHSLLDAIHIKRHIDYLYPQRRPTTLEIGAGSGYVGALLVVSGHRYVSTDIAQAFYLYQSHLLDSLAGNRFAEGVVTDASSEDNIVHLPWWKFYRIDGQPDISAEVITANHCLCEMHPTAASYVLRLTTNLLSANPTGALVFFSVGSQVLRRATDLLKTIELFGLRLAYHDEQITVVIGPEHPEYKQTMDVIAGKLPESTELPRYVTDGRIGCAISEGRKATNKAITLSMDGVREMLQRALGQDDIRTDDRIFLDVISPS